MGRTKAEIKRIKRARKRRRLENLKKRRLAQQGLTVESGKQT